MVDRCVISVLTFYPGLWRRDLYLHEIFLLVGRILETVSEDIIVMLPHEKQENKSVTVVMAR